MDRISRLPPGILLVAICAALMQGTLDSAGAQSGVRQEAELALTATSPGAASGWRFFVDYVDPANPEGKPPAVRRVITQLAPGAEIDTSVPIRCEAPDAALIAAGPAACPAASRVGQGYIRIDTGVPGPGRFIESDVTVFNANSAVILLSTERNSGVRVVTRSTVEQGRTISMAPPLPGAPPDGGAIDIAAIELNQVTRNVGGVLRSFVTTPPECPGSGRWTHTLEFTYADGVTQTVESGSDCAPAGSADASAQASTVCANRITGGDRADVLMGSGGGDEILAGGGRDRARGRSGEDCLSGQAGGDRLSAGAGSDAVAGGMGADVIRTADGTPDTIRCGPGPDRVVADPSDHVARRCENVR